jgi:hypothetical protein
VELCRNSPRAQMAKPQHRSVQQSQKASSAPRDPLSTDYVEKLPLDCDILLYVRQYDSYMACHERSEPSRAPRTKTGYDLS